MKSLGIITINHKRPQVLTLWCAQIKRIREELNLYIPAVVVSEEEDKPICDRYHVVHITQENKPVTSKFNRAFKYMQGQGQDYVMTLGSDDIVSTQFVKDTMALMETGVDLIGVWSFYFYSGHGRDRGKLVKLERPNTRTFLGIGRTVSSRVLDQCDWTLWDVEKNWGMDAIASKTLAKYTETRATVEGMIVDVKTDKNLNSFRIWSKRLPEVDPQEFYRILSKEELEILKSL